MTYVSDVTIWIDHLLCRLDEADELTKFVNSEANDEYKKYIDMYIDMYIDIKNEFERCSICSAPKLPHVRAGHELR